MTRKRDFSGAACSDLFAHRAPSELVLRFTAHSTRAGADHWGTQRKDNLTTSNSSFHLLSCHSHSCKQHLDRELHLDWGQSINRSPISVKDWELNYSSAMQRTLLSRKRCEQNPPFPNGNMANSSPLCWAKAEVKCMCCCLIVVNQTLQRQEEEEVQPRA